jgi:hypothetical protein
MTHPPESPLRSDLARELGGDASCLSSLSADELAALLVAIRDTRKHQREALDAAIAHGMSLVPALLRAPLRRILFP